MTTQTTPQNNAVVTRQTAKGQSYFISLALVEKAHEAARNGRDGGYLLTY